MHAIADTVAQIPTKLAELPNKFIDGIKGIFVPDEGVVDEYFENVRLECMKLLVSYDLERLFEDETEINDVKITVYGKEAVILDSGVLKEGIVYFRPYIRGFLVLLLVLFNVNQFLSLIGAHPISIAGLAGGHTEQPLLPDKGVHE